jgi:hypothetical protein
MTLFFVDVEAFGAVPALGKMTEFGIVTTKSETYHGLIIKSTPDPANPAAPLRVNVPAYELAATEMRIAKESEQWIKEHGSGERAVMVSDNPAFDFMWMADFYWRTLGYCPFGHSARRIGDFYAGLVHDFDAATRWKKLRVTKHTHHPVDDAMGNMEAFKRIMKGER